jgi:outer membrane protein OmpA-like peptidoglycan-associated protein
MTIRHALLGSTFAAAILAGGLALATPASAGDLSAQQIENGLKMPITRGLSPASRPTIPAADLTAINQVRGLTRSLSMDERTQMAEIASKRPKVNLEINFEYNSATLTPKAEPQLEELARVLTGPNLAGTVVMLGGHTDAKGGEAYNQQLSEKRSETVKRYLVTRYKIAPDTLITAGYGKNGLKNAADPYAGENRRVEIVNMAQRNEANAAATNRD